MNKIKNLSFVFIIIYLFPTNIFSSDNLNTKIYKNLRCLVCQGQSIADSNSEFALTLKCSCATIASRTAFAASSLIVSVSIC